MEMCYGGALVMPSNYAVMNEEEMMYLDGDGIFRVYGSAKAARTIARGTVALISGLIGSSSSNILAAGLSATLGVFVFDAIIDWCGVKYRAFDFSTEYILPNFTLNVDKYI